MTAPRKLAARFGAAYHATQPDKLPGYWRLDAKPRRETRMNRRRVRRLAAWPPELEPGLRHLGAVIADMAAAMKIALEPWQRKMLDVALTTPRGRMSSLTPQPRDTMGQQPPE